LRDENRKKTNQRRNEKKPLDTMTIILGVKLTNP